MYETIPEVARKYIVPLENGRWYSGEELDKVWGTTNIARKGIIQRTVKYGLLERKGKTSMTRYRSRWKTIEPIKTEKQKPKTNLLDELIAASTNIGTENELLKQTLRDIRDKINDILE